MAAAQNFLLKFPRSNHQSQPAPPLALPPTLTSKASPSHKQSSQTQALPANASLAPIQQASTTPPSLSQNSTNSDIKQVPSVSYVATQQSQTAPAPPLTASKGQAKVKPQFVPLSWNHPAAQVAPIVVPYPLPAQKTIVPKVPNTIASTSRRKVKGSKKKKRVTAVQSLAIPQSPLPPVPPSLSDYPVPRIIQLEKLYNKYPGFKGQSIEYIRRRIGSTWPSKK
jgi:hypothetical protein